MGGGGGGVSSPEALEKCWEAAGVVHITPQAGHGVQRIQWEGQGSPSPPH